MNHQNNEQKIIVTSLHRNATKSTDLLLRKLGYKSLHWGGEVLSEKEIENLPASKVFEKFYPILDNFDAFSDVPFNCYYRELSALYPDAKFIHVVRDIPGWISSVRKHIGEREFDLYEYYQYSMYSKPHSNYITEWSDEQLQAFYMTHLNAVNNYFGGDRRKLLVCKLDDTAGKKIANFLGKTWNGPFPKVAF